jgi:hypothetical protein
MLLVNCGSESPIYLTESISKIRKSAVQREHISVASRSSRLRSVAVTNVVQTKPHLSY